MSPVAATATSQSVIKGALRGSVVYAIPLIAQRLIGIFVLSVVTRVLTPSDFGILALIEQVNAVASVLLGSMLASALGYFYFKEDSPEHRAQVVGTAVIGAFGMGCVAAAITIPCADMLARTVFHTVDARRYLVVAFGSMPFGFAAEALFGWLRVADRQRAFTMGSLLRVVLTAGGVTVLVGVLHYRVMAYTINAAAVVVVLCLCVSVYLLRTTRIAWSWTLFWQMFRFSAPMAASWIAMFVINFGDQFLLPQYRPLAEVGVYSLAYRIGMIVSIALASFFTYWNAQVYRILSREDAEPVFARFLTYCLLIVSAIAVFLILVVRPGLRILVAPGFQAAAAIVPILVAANSIRAGSEFLRTRFLAAGLPKYETYTTWIGLAVCLPMYLLLIPRYGMWGAGSATIVTLTVMGVVSVVWTYRVRAYLVEWRRLAKLGGVTAGILTVHFVTPLSSLYGQIAWAAVLATLFPVALWSLGFFNPEERRAALAFLSRFRAAPPV